MTISARDYAGRARDPRWERALAAELRKLPEEQRLAFIQDFTAANLVVALELARTCLSERRSFEALLDQAMNEADASAIRYWLAAIVPHLGIRRVVSILRRRARVDATGVAQAAYWLGSYSGQPGYSRKDVEALCPA